MKSAVLILIVVLCTTYRVNCQSDSGNGEGAWERFLNFLSRMYDTMRDLWRQIKAEISARASDMRDWSQEMLESFKTRMRSMVNEKREENSISETEANEIKDYLDKLQLPPKEGP